MVAYYSLNFICSLVFQLLFYLPHIDTPLKSIRQYNKNQNRTVHIILTDGTSREGKLLNADEAGVTVEENIKDFENNPPAFILERSSEMISQYYVFNINKTPFDNVKVRQAFSYAIDRDKIIDKVLQGQAYGPASYGITPPTFEAYKVGDIIGYNFDPEKAKKLLMEAGYPGGVGWFP